MVSDAARAWTHERARRHRLIGLKPFAAVIGSVVVVATADESRHARSRRECWLSRQETKLIE
jgi:hypothetical protein